jgi:hypothetical protein
LVTGCEFRPGGATLGAGSYLSSPATPCLTPTRRGRKSEYRNGKWQDWRPSDEIGAYSPAQFAKMDTRFCAAVERALAAGKGEPRRRLRYR